ncbi:50S ribosomal protein L14, partial [Diplocarpon rosae]
AGWECGEVRRQCLCTDQQGGGANRHKIEWRRRCGTEEDEVGQDPVVGPDAFVGLLYEDH